MKKLLIVSVVPLVLIAAFLFIFQSDGEVRVLVFSKTEGFRHQSIPAGIEAIKMLGRENGFQVDATEDAAVFTERRLKNYNIVIFLSTTGDVLNETQQLELRRFIQAGGGFVGVHAAADTEYEWPWYNKLVGGWFAGHPADPNVREGTLHVADSTHPSTEMLPSTWTRTDEWYEYKSFNEDAVHVLLNIDETSYKTPDENPAPEPHPIAWYHEIGAGRAFYTGLGHTTASYSEPLFLDHLLGGIQYAIGDGAPVNYGSANVAPEENRFTQTVLAQNLAEPVELDVLPDGRVLFIERRGDVHIYLPETGSVVTAATLDIHTGHEDGLLGVAADPNFAQNGWIYLFYSPTGTEAKQHVSRFVLSGNSLDLESEQVLLEIPTQRRECCHSAGSLEFGPEGLLYIAVGDNTNPHASDGYAPIDERDGREPWDAQRTAANTNDLRGKILRIRPEEDGTYSIPEGNLFPEGQKGRPEIYVMGVRNPYRLSVDSHTGFLYWGDIGPDAGEDSVGRGPRGYDEINLARDAGNYGWPYFIADNKPYYEYNFTTQTSGERFDPEAPINESPNNTGARILPPAQPAMIWYPYGASPTFPLVGDGGRSAMAGPVYYVDDYEDSGRNFPAYYNGKLFIYDWIRGWIMAVTLDEKGEFVRMEPFMPSTTFSNPIDMAFGPGGALYVLEYGPLWFSASPEAQLSRIDFMEGNRTPVAKIAADRTVGAPPFTVQFSGASSVDFDGDSLTYAWRFNDANAVQATGANPTFTFEESGTYRVHLAVTDPSGATDTAATQILVGNAPPEIALNLTNNRSFYWTGHPIEYDVSVSDAEDGSLDDDRIDPRRVTVSFDYLPQGSDLVQSALKHQAFQESSHALLGKRLIEASDCSSCHQQQKASIGPSYLQIAQRYRNETGAVDKLIDKIIKGGSGSWGNVAMAAHPQLSEEGTRKMVEYILSLAGSEPTTPRAPLEGTFIPDAHDGNAGTGRYILTATYTDRGGNGVGPLTAREVIILRPPRIPAEDYDSTVKGSRFVIPEDAPGGMGGMKVFLGMHGAQATYRAVDLTGVGAITAAIALAPTFTTGGWIDVYLDGIDGEKLGTLEVEQSLTSMGVNEFTLPVSSVTGVHDLTFSYRNEEESGLVGIGLWFDFRHESEVLP